MNGHWFCYNCNDVVFKHGEYSGLQPCPVCQKHTAEFIHHTETQPAATFHAKPVNDEMAKLLFANMRKAAL